MHRSRLYGFFVDAPLAQAEAAVSFWTSAFGATPRKSAPDDPYTALPGAAGSIAFEIQAVDDAPRYHLDIETDNVEAEVARLIGLGATQHQRNQGWVVLRAPGGHLLCVVPVQSAREEFVAQARVWNAAE